MSCFDFSDGLMSNIILSMLNIMNVENLYVFFLRAFTLQYFYFELGSFLYTAFARFEILGLLFILIMQHFIFIL